MLSTLMKTNATKTLSNVLNLISWEQKKKKAPNLPCCVSRDTWTSTEHWWKQTRFPFNTLTNVAVSTKDVSNDAAVSQMSVWCTVGAFLTLSKALTTRHADGLHIQITRLQCLFVLLYGRPHQGKSFGNGCYSFWRRKFIVFRKK